MNQAVIQLNRKNKSIDVLFQGVTQSFQGKNITQAIKSVQKYLNSEFPNTEIYITTGLIQLTEGRRGPKFSKLLNI